MSNDDDKRHHITPEELERGAENMLETIRNAPRIPDDDKDGQEMMLYMALLFGGVAATYKQLAKQLRELESRCGTPSPLN